MYTHTYVCIYIYIYMHIIYIYMCIEREREIYADMCTKWPRPASAHVGQLAHQLAGGASLRLHCYEAGCHRQSIDSDRLAVGDN